MPGGPDYLPPVVISIVGNIDDFLKAVAEVKAIVKDLEKPIVVPITLDSAEAVEEVEATHEEMQAAADKPLQARVEIDEAEALEDEEAVLETMQAAATANPLDLRVTLNTTSALAEWAALQTALQAEGEGLLAGRAGLFKRSAAMALLDTALATEAGGSGGKNGGGGFWGNFLGNAFFGGGSTPGGVLRTLNPLGWGMAGLGTIGSFAGFGAEHVLMTGLGLAGSFASALGGGGLLAAGALGPMGVGMGSDVGVFTSMLGDTRSYASALSNLQEAVAVYGKNSKEAAAAQYQLNASLGYASPAAKAAEMNLAALAGQVGGIDFDKATSQARLYATELATSAVQLAKDYLPLIGQAAARNFEIIDHSLMGSKGLFAWLEGPQGMGIFQDLENHFAKNLPAAMGAFTNAVEIFAKSLDYLSGKTGTWIQRLDADLSRVNTDSGMQKLEGHFNNMIASFHTWATFFDYLLRDIADIFELDAHTAQSIVQYLTQLLIQLHTYLHTTQGEEAIHNVFVVHKQEIMELLQFLPALIKGFGQLYLAVAPVATKLATDIITPLAWVVTKLSNNPFGEWIIGLTIVSSKLFGIKNLLKETLGFAGEQALIALVGKGGASSIISGGATGIFSASVDQFTAAVGVFVKAVTGQAISDTELAAATGPTDVAALGGLLGKLGIFAEGTSATTALVSVMGIVGGSALASWLGGELGKSLGGKSGNAAGGILGGVAGGAATGALIGTPEGGPFGAGVGALLGAAIGGVTGVVTHLSSIESSIKGLVSPSGPTKPIPVTVESLPSGTPHGGAVIDTPHGERNPGAQGTYGLGGASGSNQNAGGDRINVPSGSGAANAATSAASTAAGKQAASGFSSLNWYQMGVNAGAAIGPAISDSLQFVWNGITGGLSRLFGFLGNLISGAFTIVGTVWQQVPRAIGNLFLDVVGFIVQAIPTVANDVTLFIAGMLSPLTNAISLFFRQMEWALQYALSQVPGASLLGITSPGAFPGSHIPKSPAVVGTQVYSPSPTPTHTPTSGLPGHIDTPAMAPNITIHTQVTVAANGAGVAGATGDAVAKEVTRQLTKVVRQMNSGAYALIPG